MSTGIYDKFVKIVAGRLSEKGHTLIKKAYENSDYRHDKTQNLKDSYGSCVFYNGKICNGTMNFVSSKSATIGRYNSSTEREEYGRDEIISFFSSYEAKPKGFELVMAVAMFYGQYLEEGSGRLKRKYKVITFMVNEAQDIAKSLGGEVKLIKDGRSR